MKNKESWKNFGRGLCDNLNWNVCIEAINEVNEGRANPDKDYMKCLRMIYKYKTKERYMKRFR